MPDTRAHRGQHPDDAQLFDPPALGSLRQAVRDLSWLLSGSYAEKSALKLVGDRYSLKHRQRLAVLRCACADESLVRRRSAEAGPLELAGLALSIDGFNVLTTVEAALSGGIIFKARDGCYRDLASIHGTYRKVVETVPAIDLLGEVIAGWGARQCLWLLDKPVSNSGRLKKMLLERAAERGWAWRVELLNNPDAALAASEPVIATADSVVLDRCRRWVNLARATITLRVPAARVLDLSAPCGSLS